jgi:hypothetical protein
VCRSGLLLNGRGLDRLMWCGKVVAFENATLQLANGNPLLWVALKDHNKDVVQFIRYWKNGLQKVTVPGECLVCGILNAGLFPWIASTCQVDKDNTKGPNIVGRASV